MTMSGSRSINDVAESLRNLVSMERAMAAEVLDAIGSMDIVEIGRRLAGAVPARSGSCSIPEPCWMPRTLGDLVSVVAPCRTACLDIVVTNCDRSDRRITVAYDGDLKDVTISDPDFVLGPFRRRTVSVCLVLPEDAARNQRFDGVVWVRGCREGYLRWSIRASSFGIDSRHEIEVEDCPDYVHHWYDHFYCARPCLDAERAPAPQAAQWLIGRKLARSFAGRGTPTWGTTGHSAT